MSSWPCPLCEGNGCEECDYTGKRYRTTFDLEDGTIVAISGSGDGPSDAERKNWRERFSRSEQQT